MITNKFILFAHCFKGADTVEPDLQMSLDGEIWVKDFLFIVTKTPIGVPQSVFICYYRCSFISWGATQIFLFLKFFIFAFICCPLTFSGLIAGATLLSVVIEYNICITVPFFFFFLYCYTIQMGLSSIEPTGGLRILTLRK